MCICSENIDVCEHHLEEVACDNSLRRGDGRWRGHHSVDPSERRTERTFASTGPGRAKLERAGVNLDHFGEEICFEKTPFCSQWRASSQRALNLRKLLKRPGQFRRLIPSFFGGFFCVKLH